MTLWLRINIFALLVALPGYAGPREYTAVEICALAGELNAFIEASSTLAPKVGCPDVTFALPKLPTSAARSQAGAYDPISGQIALADDLDLSDPVGRSFLLHELVHAAQFQAGRQHEVRCLALLEAEAYGVQAAYLRSAGRLREALMTSLVGQHLGACTDPDDMY